MLLADDFPLEDPVLCIRYINEQLIIQNKLTDLYLTVDTDFDTGALTNPVLNERFSHFTQAINDFINNESSVENFLVVLKELKAEPVCCICNSVFPQGPVNVSNFVNNQQTSNYYQTERYCERIQYKQKTVQHKQIKGVNMAEYQAEFVKISGDVQTGECFELCDAVKFENGLKCYHSDCEAWKELV
ncbi:Hypothetical_protein [Hexamita inflata]|uniref:Hypothetical_protein n=1 Tax=Hexamita inflata TaxID=28002 RepID=A0AA86P2R5_9EUKA|nr:Hypothetical protein HINF_LOCUS17750 [Hexamita inflata]